MKPHVQPTPRMVASNLYEEHRLLLKAVLPYREWPEGVFVASESFRAKLKGKLLTDSRALWSAIRDMRRADLITVEGHGTFMRVSLTTRGLQVAGELL